ncbi:MAG: hypothetical protein KC496_21195, partial [Anaerolineae bacterium]|nr:hypothetical protein [Anaerolineae bacterium]
MVNPSIPQAPGRIRSSAQAAPETQTSIQKTEKRLSYWATLDKPLVLIVGLLLVIGAGMVFSTTFNWSLEDFGSSTAIFLQRHLRNVGLALVMCAVFAVVDYRFWKRFVL